MPPPDEAFGRDIAEAVALLNSEVGDPWDDELAIASVSVAEYRVGIELADTADRARALAAVMSAVEVLDYTQAAISPA